MMFKLLIYIVILAFVFYYWDSVSPVLHGLLNGLDSTAAWVQQLLRENEALIDKATNNGAT